MSALAALAAAAWMIEGPQFELTASGAAVCCLVLWIVLTNRWLNPSYTAAAPYHSAFLLGGFLLGRRAGVENARLLFACALAFASVLAGWAIWQTVGLGVPRAYGPFETPATLSAVINLALLPSVISLMAGPRNKTLIAGVLLLTAGLIVGASRGAWFALGASALIALLLARRARLAVDYRIVALSGAIVLIAALFIISMRVPAGFSGGLDIGSARQRLGLDELALKGIASAPLATGIGYLGFYYLVEPVRTTLMGEGGSPIYFVHNDYLQTLLELGIPGLAFFLLLIALAPAMAWRALPSLDRYRAVFCIACIGSLASMSIHALIDFPFYVPICLLTFGTVAGLLDSTVPAASVRLPRLVAVIAATAASWLLITPAAAQAAAEYANREWRLGRGEEAAYWFEAARRIEPRDWRYHWYAGQFWMAQAAAKSDPAAARLADVALAAGYAANTREARDLYSRLFLHTRLRSLLATPAERQTLEAWANQAAKLAPADPALHAEADRLLSQSGVIRKHE